MLMVARRFLECEDEFMVAAAVATTVDILLDVPVVVAAAILFLRWSYLLLSERLSSSSLSSSLLELRLLEVLLPKVASEGGL